jgi:lipopolysaccharide/colanic/teichoic acid biosynthesis glycosyltransferase
MYKSIKKISDISIAFVMLIVLSPLFIVFILLSLLIMGYPAFFTQKRIGLNNRPYIIYKFRSMLPRSERHKTDAERTPLFGRILRQFRIDELPQLINILIGDMSFIGPRPLLPEYLNHYTENELRRHDVRPGLSGYSQIKNLNSIGWEEQFEMDLYYVDNLSFKLDVYILFKTITRILQPTRMSNTRIADRPRFDNYRMQKKEENVK